MSDKPAVKNATRGDKSKNEAGSYVSNFAGQNYTAFGKALSLFMRPGSPHSELLAFFDNRASAQQIRDWRLGRSSAPTWAREMLGARLAAIGTDLAREPAGEIGRAGTEALRRYKLERRALNNQR